MKKTTWAILFSIIACYVVAVLLFGFPGAVAYSIHFIRVAVTVAVLVIYLPAIGSIFNEVPPPRRDYLLAGIVLTWLSGLSFSAWNEFGKVLGVDTSIFTSPVAGFFSLLLLLGGCFHLIAPETSKKGKRIIALAIGLASGIAIVLIAPYFRGD